MKTLLLALLLLASPAWAQTGTYQTKPAMQTEINTNFADNTTGAITPAILRATVSDMLASWQQIGNVNAQVGTAYTIAVGDNGKLVTLTNAAPVAVTLPQATISFANFSFSVSNRGAGTVTITPVTSTINGGATLTIAATQAAFIYSDGANYQAINVGAGGGGGSPTGPAGGDLAGTYPNPLLAQMPANTVKCNPTGSTANVLNCSAINVTQSGDTTTFLTPPPGFGGNWFSIYNFATNFTSTHATDSRFTVNIARTTNGSTVNGPGSADFGAVISCGKNSYLSSAVDGECDALYLVTAQGAKGDSAAVNLEAQKVFGSGSDTGSVLGSETSVRRLDTSGLIAMDIHALSGFGEGAGGPSNNTGYGYYAENQRQASGMSSTTTTPFSAFYGDSFDISGSCVTANCPTFTNFAVGSGIRSAGTTHQFFRVGWGLAETGDIQVGSGAATGADGTTSTQSGGTRWTMKNVGGTWQLLANNGSTSMATITQAGTLTAGAATFNTNPGSSSAIFNFVNSHDTANDNLMVMAVGPTSATDTTSTYVAFEDGAQTIIYGSIKRNTGSAVSYNTTSDARLKDAIGPSAFGLGDLMQIKVRDFSWKADPDRVAHNGFFAQELSSVYPEAVSVGGDDPQINPWQVDYGRLSPLIVKSIQEMQHEIDDLRARLTSKELADSAVKPQ